MNHVEINTPSKAVLPMVAHTPVTILDEVIIEQLQELLLRFNLQLELVAENHVIPGSYWGDCEAGLIGNNLYARLDTPVHSILHEVSHYICMDDVRRAALHRDAGGDYDEENAVCYLQILLADCVIGFDRGRMQHDMDLWGYTFRLGSARAWFETDAIGARIWLMEGGLIAGDESVTGQLRH